jgi:hypothetical protein
MAEWCNRPLEPVYPVVSIDAIHVKIRDGQVTNRPVYVAIGVTCGEEGDILPVAARRCRRGCEGLARGAHSRSRTAAQAPAGSHIPRSLLESVT